MNEKEGGWSNTLMGERKERRFCTIYIHVSSRVKRGFCDDGDVTRLFNNDEFVMIQ